MDGMLVHRRAVPTIKLAVSCLYARVEKDKVRLKGRAQERNTTSLGRPPAQTSRSGEEHSNHEAISPV